MLLKKAENVYNLITTKYSLASADSQYGSLDNVTKLKAFIALKIIDERGLAHFSKSANKYRTNEELVQVLFYHVIRKNPQLSKMQDAVEGQLMSYVKNGFFIASYSDEAVLDKVNNFVEESLAKMREKKNPRELTVSLDQGIGKLVNFYNGLNNNTRQLEALIAANPNNNELKQFKNYFVAIMPFLSEASKKYPDLKERTAYLVNVLKQQNATASSIHRLFSKFAQDGNFYDLITELTPFVQLLYNKHVQPEIAKNQQANNNSGTNSGSNSAVVDTSSNNSAQEPANDYFTIFKNQYLNYLNTESVMNVKTESNGVMQNFPFSYIVSMIASTKKSNYVQSVSTAGGTFLYYLWANNFFNKINKKTHSEFNDQTRALVLKECLQNSALLLNNFSMAIDTWLDETADKTIKTFPQEYSAQLANIKQDPSFVQLQTDVGQQYKVAVKNYIMHMINYQKSYYAASGLGALIGITDEQSQQEASSVMGPDGKPINWASIFEANAKKHIFEHIKTLLLKSAPQANKIISSANVSLQQRFIYLLHKSQYCDPNGQSPDTALFKSKINGLSAQIESIARQALSNQ